MSPVLGRLSIRAIYSATDTRALLGIWPHLFDDKQQSHFHHLHSLGSQSHFPLQVNMPQSFGNIILTLIVDSLKH
jgi:hypothetical protein